MERFIDHYATIQQTLKVFLQTEDSVTGSSKLILMGYGRLLQKFETLLETFNIYVAFFRLCEELAMALQSSTYHATVVKEAAEALCKAVSRPHSQTAFEEL